MPNWPLTFTPKHFTLDMVSIVQVIWSPAETATTLWPMLTLGKFEPIWLSASPLFWVSPYPSWPAWFPPQHFKAPDGERMAHT